MGYRKLLLFAIVAGSCSALSAQAPSYDLGKTLTPKEIQAFDSWVPISPEGVGLPPGSGTAAEGAKIYSQKCAMCHGQNGRGGQAPALIMSKEPTATDREKKVLANSLPFAPVLWDYIHRAMPVLIGPGTLKPDEVYALTAFLLSQNDVIKETDVMDAQTLSRVKMPNRDAFVSPEIRPRKPS